MPPLSEGDLEDIAEREYWDMLEETGREDLKAGRIFMRMFQAGFAKGAEFGLQLGSDNVARVVKEVFGEIADQ